MDLYQRIDEVLQHFDYALVGVKGNAVDNKLYANFPTTNNIMYRDFTIAYGAKRVSKHKGMIKIKDK